MVNWKFFSQSASRWGYSSFLSLQKAAGSEVSRRKGCSGAWSPGTKQVPRVWERRLPNLGDALCFMFQLRTPPAGNYRYRRDMSSEGRDGNLGNGEACDRGVTGVLGWGPTCKSEGDSGRAVGSPLPLSLHGERLQVVVFSCIAPTPGLIIIIVVIIIVIWGQSLDVVRDVGQQPVEGLLFGPLGCTIVAAHSRR